MGRATIVGGGEDGLFTISLDYGQGMRDAMVARIDARIEQLNVSIAEKGDAIALAELDTQAAQQVVAFMIDALTAAMQADPKGNHSALIAAVEDATRTAFVAQAREASFRVPRDLEIAERASLVRHKGELQAALVTETRQAWCVDLTESAAGSVATIEVPGEDQAILLAPGARPPGAADGRLLARELMTPEQVFFNAAILPGWQKFKPTYRTGTITALDQEHDLATVSLDAAQSSAQGLGVNQAPVLTGVPVQYMTCNAGAFEVGDRVVVAFNGQFWSSPRVIGFVSNPKACVRYTVEFTVVQTGTGFLGDEDYDYEIDAPTVQAEGKPPDSTIGFSLLPGRDTPVVTTSASTGRRSFAEWFTTETVPGLSVAGPSAQVLGVEAGPYAVFARHYVAPRQTKLTRTLVPIVEPNPSTGINEIVGYTVTVTPWSGRISGGGSETWMGSDPPPITVWPSGSITYVLKHNDETVGTATYAPGAFEGAVRIYEFVSASWS